MKSVEWKTYRTRFLVKAKQLNYSLSFTDPLGRQHCGRKGDYLVESYDGVISIAPRQIFEDIYVPMLGEESSTTTPLDSVSTQSAGILQLNSLPIESLEIARINDTTSHSRLDKCRADQVGAARARRKSPQPVRAASSRAGLM